MRGRYLMSEQDEHKVADTPAPAARHARASLADLLAFLGVLVLAGALALLVDRTGQLSARLAFAGAAGLVAACVNAWRRLRRVELRRWRRRPGDLPRPPGDCGLRLGDGRPAAPRYRAGRDEHDHARRDVVTARSASLGTTGNNLWWSSPWNW